MRVFGQLWENGRVIFHEASKITSIETKELDFGYQFLATLAISDKKVEAFSLKVDQLFAISNNFAICDDFLVGFLSERIAQAHLSKTGEELKGYLIYPSYVNMPIESEPFILLKGARKDFLFKEYLRIVIEHNRITKTNLPLRIVSSSVDEFEKRAQHAVANNCDSVLIPYTEDEKILKHFVSICKELKLQPMVSLKFDTAAIKRLKELGIECFRIQFSDFGEFGQLSNLLKDFCVIADNLSWLQATSYAAAIVMKKPFVELPAGDFLREMVANSLLSKVIKIYLEVDETDEETLKIMNILGYGLIFRADAKPLPKLRLLNVSRIFDDFQIEYIDEHNKYGIFDFHKGFVEEPKKIFLVKNTVLKENRRLFHFYTEGGK